jgi:cyclopropane-fatty-acyl-phospholipid synthase
MPSKDLLLAFQNDVELVERWRVSGRHYARTAEPGSSGSPRTSTRSRAPLGAAPSSGAGVFFLACAELWGYRDGTEWFVAHYLFRPLGPGDDRFDGLPSPA